MAELSGTAKLANGNPAQRIVAVHPLRGHVRTTVPAPDGSYAIPGVPKGRWLVTAEGPPGYRPLTHLLDVDRVPEAETLYPKVWEAWNFNDNRVGQKRGSEAVTNAAGVGVFVPGREGSAISIAAAINATHGYSPGASEINHSGYACWIRFESTAGVKNLPTIHSSASTSGLANALVDASIPSGDVRVSIRARLSSGTRYSFTVPRDIPLWEWVFFAVAVSEDGVRAWVNDESFIFPQSIPPGSSNWQRHMTVQNLGGLQVDDLCQFIGPPTDDEIAYLYAGGLGRIWAQIVEDAGF